LIIGPRFENEFFIARGLGWKMKNIFGLDLLSYSKKVTIGDMHKMPFDANLFDSIVCGWTISYSLNPKIAAKEIDRVLKSKGLLVFGVNIVDIDYKQDLDVLTAEKRIQKLDQFEELFPSYNVLAHHSNLDTGVFIVVLEKI